MKMRIKKLIVHWLERLCCLTHPFHSIETKLFGNHCQLTLLSLRLDEKWGTGLWVEEKDETC
jgi:hypothetical protein